MKCEKKNIRAIAKPSDRRLTTMLPLQKRPRKRPQLRRRPRQRKRTLRRKAVPPLAPHPAKAAKKRRQRALKSQAAHEQRHLRLAISKMRQQMEDIKRKFGFVSDCQRPRWKNFEDAAGKMNTTLLQHQISNKSCHNLLRRLDLPPCTSKKLGLNLNYFTVSNLPLSTTQLTPHSNAFPTTSAGCTI